MTRLPAKRRNKFFLDSYGRYTPKLDPQLLTLPPRWSAIASRH